MLVRSCIFKRFQIFLYSANIHCHEIWFLKDRLRAVPCFFSSLSFLLTHVGLGIKSPCHHWMLWKGHSSTSLELKILQEILYNLLASRKLYKRGFLLFLNVSIKANLQAYKRHIYGQTNEFVFHDTWESENRSNFNSNKSVYKYSLWY